MVRNQASRQRASRPVVSFRLSAALHQEAETFRRTHGLTWEALIQQAIAGGVQPDVQRAHRQGQQVGFEKAKRQFALKARCYRCGELTWAYASQFPGVIDPRTTPQNSLRFLCPDCWEQD
jgi:hypothetical protein